NIVATGNGALESNINKCDTLLYTGSVSARLSLTDLLGGNSYSIENLTVTNSVLNINHKTIPDSILYGSDYEAQKTTATKDVTSSKKTVQRRAENGLKLQVKNITVRNLNICYIDKSDATVAKLLNINCSAAGTTDDATGAFTVNGDAGELVLEYDSIRYIGGVTLKLNSAIAADYGRGEFRLENTTLHINELPLELNGLIAMPDDSIRFDLTFRQAGSDFTTLLSLMPYTRHKYLSNISTTGAATFDGSIKGLYYNNILPAINVRLQTDSATLRFDGAGGQIEKISANCLISKPEGRTDLLTISMDVAAFVRENGLHMKLALSHPTTDLQFDVALSGKADFTQLADVIPMDSLEMRGLLEGHVAFNGHVSDIDSRNYDRITADGQVQFDGFRLQTPRLTRAVEIGNGAVTLTNTQLRLTNLQARIGQSDFRLSGALADVLPYLLRRKTLSGDFTLQSAFINFDELAGLFPQKAPKSPADSTKSLQIPDNLNLTFRSNIARSKLANMDITNMDGLIAVKNRQLVLQKLNMNLLDGQLMLDGAYHSNPEKHPTFDFNIRAANFQIPTAFRTFSLLRRYAPVAGQSHGKMSATMNFRGQFDQYMNIIHPSLNGTGNLTTSGLQVNNPNLLAQLKSVIKPEKLQNLRVADFSADFRMNNGAITVIPFTTSIVDQEVTVGGEITTDQQLALQLDFRVNKDDLNGDAAKLLAILPGSSNLRYIDAGIRISGAATDPQISVDLTKARKQIENEIKKAGSDGIKNSIENLLKLFK
ncbi:MAG: AsmA-like C-terminal region-containing protein, partial [Bacteroidales bacterium]|nr:AsmA-like C-terminal region-containing protein [Bacteroidales bacterium]